ncbi:unannotated protein [freshwater metagenome]|uniref:Unannotated protein n=1 Tax=freshwater metagenome TaxID=449393 RepID=A0A6J7A8G4_9ZZZZ
MLCRPLAGAVAGGVLVRQRDRLLQRRVFGDTSLTFNQAGGGERRDEVDALLTGRECEPRHLRGAHHIRSEQVLVVEDVVHQRGWMHNAVDFRRQPRVRRFVEAQQPFGDVAHDHLQPFCGERGEARAELGIALVEAGRQPALRGVVVGGAHEADHLAGGADLFHPFEAQEAAKETGRTRDEDDPRLRRRFVGRHGGEVCVAEEAFDVEVGGIQPLCTLAMDLSERRLGVAIAIERPLDGGSPTARVAGGADDVVERQVDAEDLFEQRGQLDRTERVATQLGERGRIVEVGVGETEHRAQRTGDLLPHRQRGIRTA